ncbi:capsular biosynthesis protein [Vibrio coralliirubri]|uniref:capsular biosynthesis protein n=1 Tax=Vibrio coralliirubri TaxID=1516159 RepID=UPI0006315FE9|nr:capsular biosynthesis protein [Vibrio coralliirubri]CDS95355.1 conserved hypothetical protein [Vibrio coralliirubri]
MFLIMSAAYVGQELESEFGKIPPSFLPLGNRRLFQHQIALAPEGTDILLSIPESFAVSSVDESWLKDKNVTVLRTPENLTLGASLVAALNISGLNLNKPLHVLYGDTLYRHLPTGDDIVSVSKAKGSYNWATLTTDKNHWLKNNEPKSNMPEIVVDGYFKFSSPRELIKNITQSEWCYLEGLNRYHSDTGLIAVESVGWLDFGHVNTYYNSKAEFTTQRAFNELKITSAWIEKSSIKNEKISAEANWFINLPFSLKGYTPQFLGMEEKNDSVSYRLEYLHLTALNELFVFSKLPSQTWNQILKSCMEFLVSCQKCIPDEKCPGNSLEQLFTIKTEQRLKEYCKANNITIDDSWSFNGGAKVSLSSLIKDSVRNLPKNSEAISVMHGDFCFSNILYDFRANKIKTIDPRGITTSGEKTIYGDIRYDISKLSHSILGLYDVIIAGYYHVKTQDYNIRLVISEENAYKETQCEFVKLVEETFGLTAKNLYAMQIQLFLSMLPLHADDLNRQKALFANAFRLHAILMRLEQ